MLYIPKNPVFISKNKVRMHDTDMAGILYFPRQFRFVHDALEDLMEKEGLSFDALFRKEPFVFVIVRAESNYLVPLHVGDALEVRASVEKIGTSSFTMKYEIYKTEEPFILAGTAKTVHVSLDNKTRTKIFLPNSLLSILNKYLSS